MYVQSCELSFAWGLWLAALGSPSAGQCSVLNEQFQCMLMLPCAATGGRDIPSLKKYVDEQKQTLLQETTA